LAAVVVDQNGFQQDDVWAAVSTNQRRHS
jgi:hypothetical protein